MTIWALLTLPSALFKVCSFGTTLIFAIKSPVEISSPSSTYSSCIIPAIWGTTFTSSSGKTFPVATILSSIVAVIKVCVSYWIADVLFDLTKNAIENNIPKPKANSPTYFKYFMVINCF